MTKVIVENYGKSICGIRGLWLYWNGGMGKSMDEGKLWKEINPGKVIEFVDAK